MKRLLLFGLATSVVTAACDDEGSAFDVRGTLGAPDLVDYGDIPLGFQATRIVELINEGTGPVTVIGSEVVTRDPTHRFEVVNRIEDARIRPGLPFEVRVRMQALNPVDEPRESTIRFDVRLRADEKASIEVRLRARGVDQGLVARPNPVDFGRVRIGSSVQRDVEIINLLSQPVDVFSAFTGTEARVDEGDAFFTIVTAADPSRNGSLLEEGEMLRPGQRTVVTVQYTPQATSIDELNSGEWTVRSCEDSLCETTIGLRGFGVRNLLACEPEAVDFGTVQPERTADAFVRCRNVANVALNVEGWELADFSDEVFSVEPPVDFPRRVDPGDSFEIATSFTGATIDLGLLSQGAIDVFARVVSDRASANTEIALRGTSGGPQIEVARELPFGEVIRGERANASLQIGNSGFADLEFERFQIVGADAAVFAVDGDPPGQISEQNGRRVDFVFDPQEARAYEATLVIETNDPLEPVVRVALSGRGVDFGTCEYTLEPQRISFGRVPVEGTTERFAVFDNVGTEPCVLREVEITRDDDDVFRLGEIPISVRVDPGGRYLVPVAYTPRNELESSGEVRIRVSRTRERLDLDGVGGLAQLLASPGLVDFGNVRLGCRARNQTVSLTNVGTNQASIGEFRLDSREPEGVFSLRDLPSGLPPEPGAPRPIDAGRTLNFEVAFEPERVGSAVANLVVGLSGRTEALSIPIRGGASDASSRVDRFAQSDVNQVDLLWVIDNSRSMDFALDLVDATADVVFEVLDDSDIDYQTSVVTTDDKGPSNEPCTKLRSAPGPNWIRGSCGFFSDGDDLVQRSDWKVVNERTRPSPERAFDGLIAVPRGGPVVESGLEAMRLALTPPRVTGWNRGFLRPDADLSVVIISNEDDQGPRSVDFYAQLVTSLKGFAGRRATISAIVPPIACIPNGGSCNEFGAVRYTQAARATGGVVESIGVDQEAEPEEQAEQFAEKLLNVVSSATSVRSLFSLSETPAPGTIEVRVDGGPLEAVAPSGAVNWTYEPTANRIRFSERGRPAPGSEVEVEYQTFCF